MIKKYHYYKNIVIKNYIEKGIYPNNSQIEKTINRIDLALPILQDYAIHEGDTFDTEKYNDTLTQIYTDLKYLCEITNDLAVSKLNYLKAFLNSHLIDMQNKANAYNMRALIEKNSSALGETLVYKTNIYPTIVDNSCTIELEKGIELIKQSKLACILNADNISNDDIVFKFINTQTGQEYYSNAYNVANIPFTVPGNLISNKYSISFNENETISSQTKISLENSTYSKTNNYNIYSGKNKCIIKNTETGTCTITDIPINTACTIEEHSYIEFYVLDGNDIVFTFNKKPINTNFQIQNNRANVTTNKRIFIECDEGFVFNISIDSGTIYAYQNTLKTINNDNILINNPHKLYDFLVYEYQKNTNMDLYDIQVIINNVNTQYITIKSIIVKELLS